jgi:damage-control phosphatase, subfamily I
MELNGIWTNNKALSMKIKPRCGVCFIQRTFKEIQLATNDPTHQFEVLKAAINLFSKEFDENAIAAVLGTKRDRLIHQLTNCADPYKELKVKSNQLAEKLALYLKPVFKSKHDPYERFRFAILVAIVGNILEFDILEHTVDLENPSYLQDLIMKAEEDLAIDDIKQIYQIVQREQEVLYLIDNAGEIIFDKLLILELLNLGVKVTAVVKEYPVLNDATMEDAKFAGLVALTKEDARFHLISTGTDHVGLIINEISDEFRTVFKNSKTIIAKGMGYYETLTELPLNKPIIYLFRTKCSAVAEDAGVSIDKNVAMLRLNENLTPNKI